MKAFGRDGKNIDICVFNLKELPVSAAAFVFLSHYFVLFTCQSRS